MKWPGFVVIFIISSIFRINAQFVPILWEDFNGDSLDTKTWIVGYPWGPVNNTNTYMLAKNIKVANGQLTITALHENYIDNGIVRTNTSGAISSHLRFLKGAFAIKFKASSLFWPAFWIYGAKGNEIDFFELGNDCDPILGICTIDRTKMVHIGTETGGGKWYDVNKDWSSDWHIIGGNWDGNVVDMYVDGIYIDTYPAHFQNELGIIIDLEVNDKDHLYLHTKVPSDADFPGTMAIDWVRAWAPIDCNTENDICSLDANNDHIFTGSKVILAKNSSIATCGDKPCPKNADCNISITKGDHLFAYATDYIELNPGFSVVTDTADPNNDAFFSAQIVNCNPDTEEFFQLGVVKNPLKVNSDSVLPPFNQINADLEIFPNPSEGIYHLNLLNVQGQTPFTFEIIDGLGNIVLTKSSIANTDDILDMTSYRAGIYIIAIKIDNQIVHSKIMKL